ncbi:hypothetical protein ABVG11_22650 [Streptomyces sp. HD1123-B1]|uniref:hypothetical protein n=1 Tax=Streptomyces huangiella TaxID=3228804 RepID=UPI003D7E27C8
MAQQRRQQQNWFARHKVLTATGALVAVIAVGGVAAGGGGDDTKGGSESGTVASGSGGGSADGKGGKDAKSNKDGAKKAPPALGGDGTFEVGAEVKPGTYRSTGNTMCYWERAKDSSGEPDAILANDNVTGSTYVTVKASDKIFKSEGCEDWEAVPATASGSPKTGMTGDGMYRIGADIAPGTYKSTGNGGDDGCYWERSKDALHGVDSIIANENVSGNAIVTIGAKDAYFKTNGCKNWKKTG